MDNDVLIDRLRKQIRKLGITNGNDYKRIYFKEGDRVYCIPNKAIEGDIEKKIYQGVIKIANITIGVEHDEDIDGHALGGRYKDRHGWYYNDVLDGYIIKQSDFDLTVKQFVFTNGKCEEKEVLVQDGI